MTRPITVIDLTESYEDANEDDSSDSSYEPPPRKPVKEKRTTKVQKGNIPKVIRNGTWATYIGKSTDGECWCCGQNITIYDWHAGHVIARANGGSDTVANLRPLCKVCNLSMGTKHMKKFMLDHDFKGKGITDLQ
jgi:5-methylcytosine-specific restriction endonuclease McrA